MAHANTSPPSLHSLDPWQALVAFTVLDRFSVSHQSLLAQCAASATHHHHQPDREQEAAGRWDISQASKLELDLLSNANEALHSVAALYNYRPVIASCSSTSDTHQQHHYLMLLRTDDRHNGSHTFASTHDIRAIETQLQHLVEQANRFDYRAIVESLVARCQAAVLHVRPNLFQRDDLHRIYLAPTVGFNEEWSAGYDIAFQVGLDHGNQLNYPDANTYIASQYKEAQSRILHPERVYTNHVHRCCRAIPHEITHCLQARYHHKDTNPFNWASEHDASFLCGSLFEVAASIQQSEQQQPEQQQPEQQQPEQQSPSSCSSSNSPPPPPPPVIAVDGQQVLFCKGLLESVRVEWLDDLLYLHQRDCQELQEAYSTWRDSFGQQAPDELSATQSTYFKDRIAFEMRSRNIDVFASQLDALFDGRTGIINHLPIPPPDALYRTVLANPDFRDAAAAVSSSDLQMWLSSSDTCPYASVQLQQ
jgi:hypothetical protein